MTDIRRFACLEDMSKSAAEYFINAIRNSAGRKSGLCSIALPGGNSSKRLYELLGSPDFSSRVDWETLRIFFSDERCVVPESGESNYALIKTHLLSRVPVPEGHIFRIPAEGPDPDESARQYERRIREEFIKMGPGHMSLAMPMFDIIILGVGADGHTASLFPGSPALDEKFRWVLYSRGGPELRTRDRITLTLPVINASGRIVFIVSGKEKGPALEKIFSHDGPDPALPASMVHGNEETVWFIDESSI
ncbi:MAG: 6-phosphogluconolactonase [Brevinematales bacterium]|jgi:6-phosphogluconolactonase